MASSSDSGSDTSSSSTPPPNSLAGLSLSIFADLLSNLTHDIALQTHHAEKLLRTRQQHLLPDTSPPPASTPNPLSTVPSEILCERCRLPLYTPNTLPNTSAKKKYCPQKPWHNTLFHDIYGNPFPTIKDKKPSTSSTDSPPEDTPPTSTNPGKKQNSSAPGIYFACPICGNKALSSRFTSHLEKCLFGGRKSSRAAMAKINSSGSGSGINSPMLAPADAPKVSSRKPSPEKKSKSPVPNLNGEDTPTLPPKPAFVAAAATTTTTSTPKKKKKKVVAVPVDLPPPPTPSKIDVPPLPPLPPLVAPVVAPVKKRKRKTEAVVVPAVPGESQSVGGDGGDGSITVSKPPVSKKQKLSMAAAEKAEKGEKMEREKSLIGEGLPIKKNQVNKFKSGRGNSPSPGGGVRKDGRTSSPSLLASPPTTHKSLPPRPPIPLSGNPLASPPPSSSATPKPRKPKPGSLGGSAKKFGEGSVKKNGKSKLKKGVNVGPSVSTSSGVSVGVSGVAGKTVPRVGGKSVPVPGVARKGVKE